MDQIRDRIKEFVRVPASVLRAHPKNWRVHSTDQRAAMETVLGSIGFAGAVLARETPAGLEIIDGHLRADLSEDQEVPVLILDVNEQEAAAILATFDPLGAMAETDEELYASLIDDAKGADEELDQLLDTLAEEYSIEEQAEPIVEDEAPEPPAEPITQPGDIWIMGDHRLLCGDCRREGDATRLFGDSQINLAVTSPPYAEQREYDPTSGFKPIPPNEYVAWFEGVQEVIRERLAEGGSFFLNIKPCASGLDTDLYVFDLVVAFVRKWGWHFATEFCWERSGIPKSVTRRFKNQFEPVYQFALSEWKMRPDAVRVPSEAVPRARGKGAGNTSWKNAQGGGSIHMSGHQGEPGFEWFGDNVGEGLAYPGNRLPTLSGSHEALGHNAAYPVGLPAFFIAAYTDKGDLVYEPFAGSGSTIIAAEQLGRRCYAMEISGQYVDVALMRWAKLTGEKAERL